MALTRGDFIRRWGATHAAAVEAKSSMDATFWMFQMYEAAGPGDREVIEGVARDWVLTGDAAQRYDALALIRRFMIVAARGEIEALLAPLHGETRGPSGALREKLVGVLASLDTESEPPG